MAEPTLEEALRAAGYDHRPNPSGCSIPGREVYRVSDGEVVGVMRAREAWAWMREQGLYGQEGG